MIQHFSEWAYGLATTFSSNKLLPSPTALFVTVFAILGASSIVRVLRKTPLKYQLPPGPRGLPILGYLPFIGTHLHVTFAELAKQYGPIYKLWLGNKLCVVVSSPALVKEIVRDKDTILVTDYGPDWHKMRKLFVQEMLANASIDACYDKRREGVQLGVKQVYCNIGKPVDIGRILVLTMVDVVVRMVWSGSILGKTQVDGPDLRQLLADFMVLMASPNLSDFFPALAWLDLQSVAKRMKIVTAHIDKILEEAINESRKSSGSSDGSRDLLHNLLELQDRGDSESSLSMNQLKGLLKDIAIGGTDTTATITEWALAELFKHPEMLILVYEELTQVVGLDSMVEESHLPNLHYLKAVLKETHRLHPAIPFLVPRRPSQTTDIGGYTIPKDTEILINVWAIHRDEKLWDRPLEFRPERFLNYEVKWDYSGNDFRYLPFGSGRRVCAGLPLAERMQMYVLASFLHCFKWEVAGGEDIDMSETFGIVLKKAVPLVAVPTPRLSNLELYA